ncbi:hypothetical protein ACFRAO_07550 [Streptomyces sp. NPDC056656]|uniref:hypothetical protein n=1 Tax=Streptomyces sp. NPDC056656 TaxID=3345895 RepID=UPI0036CCE111
MAYGFMIGPGGEFGIDAYGWTPLYASTDGWVESLALAHHARYWATSITKIKGAAVDAVDLDGYEPVPAELLLGRTGHLRRASHSCCDWARNSPF